MKDGVPEFGDKGVYEVDEEHLKAAVVVGVHSSTMVAVLCQGDMSVRTSVPIGEGVGKFNPDATVKAALETGSFGQIGTFHVDDKFTRRGVVFAKVTDEDVCVMCEHELAFRTPIKVGAGIGQFQPDAG